MAMGPCTPAGQPAMDQGAVGNRQADAADAAPTQQSETCILDHDHRDNNIQDHHDHHNSSNTHHCHRYPLSQDDHSSRTSADEKTSTGDTVLTPTSSFATASSRSNDLNHNHNHTQQAQPQAQLHQQPLQTALQHSTQSPPKPASHDRIAHAITAPWQSSSSSSHRSRNHRTPRLLGSRSVISLPGVRATATARATAMADIMPTRQRGPSGPADDAQTDPGLHAPDRHPAQNQRHDGGADARRFVVLDDSIAIGRKPVVIDATIRIPRYDSSAAVAAAAAATAPADDDDADNADALVTLVRPSRPTMAMRFRSDYGIRPGSSLSHDDDDPDANDKSNPNWGARHGFEDHYQSEDIIFQLANGWYMYFTDHRHETAGKPTPKLAFELQDWRMRERLKTVSAALVVCLNIGVDPPDQLKTSPGAKLEAWEDPGQTKAVDSIGKALQAHYTDLSIRTRYKQYLDPSVEDIKKFCLSLRRSAKDERILFHYNGHGVPKPTASGEIWVFNRTFTQYIPVPLYDLQNWLQAPTIYVWDCSEAGHILHNYEKFIDKHETEEEEAASQDQHYQKVAFRPYIHLAATRIREHLPTNPLLPADVFTSCLTTPIEMALWSFVLQNPHRTGVTPERAKNLPGRLQERRTPKGELMWILTAITDTIAWTTLPRDVFRRYFRQDLMVAGLFRNFLLAQRIMSVYGCHPQSYPELPDTSQHPQWKSWDLAVDLMLSQLPSLERRETDRLFDFEYQASSYFAEQLSAFEVYLTRGEALDHKPPEQLPVVLQVLLSQQHRVRALILLGRFLDLGPWAVQLALSIGIFPYVVKLLQSNAAELKPIMVFIWTKIIAIDVSCQTDLIKDSGYAYFAHILRPDGMLPLVDGPEHKAMCSFILSQLCHKYRPGQVSCNGTDVMTYCLTHLRQEDNPLLKQWTILCLGQLWDGLAEAKWRGLREHAPAQLAAVLRDRCCEVRAASISALATLLGIPDMTPEVARTEESLACSVLESANDGSAIVRQEFVVFLSHFVLRFENKFVVAAYEHLLEEAGDARKMAGVSGGGVGAGGGLGGHGRRRDGDQDDRDDYYQHQQQPQQQQQQQQPHLQNLGSNHSSQQHLAAENRGRNRTRSRAGPGMNGPDHDGVEKENMHNPYRHQQYSSASAADGRDAGLSHDTIFAAMWKHALVLSVDPHPGVQRSASIVVDYVHRAMLQSPVGPLAQTLCDEASDRARKTANGVASPFQRMPPGGLQAIASTASAAAAAAAASSAPSILRRTASLLFTSLMGGEERSRPNTPPPSLGGSASPGYSSHHHHPQRPPPSSSGSSQKGRTPLDMASAPPEQNDQANAAANYGAAREPVSGAFEPRNLGEPPVLPIPSTLLHWSAEYFREPQMRSSESVEPGSAEYNERLWRRNRNETIMTKTQPQKSFAGVHRWTHSLGQINNGSQPARITFHQFEDHLAVADDGDTICVWDWARQRRLSRFSNGNPAGSVISDMRFINEDDQPLIMAGSSDGVVRVYRRYDDSGRVELATAWRALTHMVPSNVNSGMVFDWQQVTGRVLVAGDVRVIRVWSAADELCLMDIPARSGACVTSLTSDQMTGNLFVAGFGDGAIRVFDVRQRPQDSLVRKWKDDSDRQWIKSVHMQRGGQRELMSASRSGRVKLWDIRADKPLHSFQTTRETLRTASLHEHLPVFAVGTSAHVVKLFNLDGQELSRLEPYAHFLNNGRNAPISTTAFHPHRAIIGCAARGDNHINIYSCYRGDSDWLAS